MGDRVVAVGAARTWASGEAVIEELDPGLPGAAADHRVRGPAAARDRARAWRRRPRCARQGGGLEVLPVADDSARPPLADTARAALAEEGSIGLIVADASMDRWAGRGAGRARRGSTRTRTTRWTRRNRHEADAAASRLAWSCDARQGPEYDQVDRGGAGRDRRRRARRGARAAAALRRADPRRHPAQRAARAAAAGPSWPSSPAPHRPCRPAAENGGAAGPGARSSAVRSLPPSADQLRIDVPGPGPRCCATAEPTWNSLSPARRVGTSPLQPAADQDPQPRAGRGPPRAPPPPPAPPRPAPTGTGRRRSTPCPRRAGRGSRRSRVPVRGRVDRLVEGDRAAARAP